jgi:hypothetical protein
MYAIIPAKNTRMTLLTILTTATVFPLLDMPKAKPKNTITGIRYANSPNIPNKILLIPVAAAPWTSPVTHKNEKIDNAKMMMSITSFFTATSTLFLVFFLVEFLALELEPEVFFLVVVLVLFDLDLAVFVRLRGALLLDADAIITSPKMNINKFS